MHFCRLDKKRYTRTTKLNTVGCVSDYTFDILLKQISKKIHTLVRLRPISPYLLLSCNLERKKNSYLEITS